MKEISKLISYWLRHKPTDASLEIDEFGWVKIEDVLNSLKERGKAISFANLKEMSKSFDKVRWEFENYCNET